MLVSKVNNGSKKVVIVCARDFFVVIMIQEMMGFCRNCGVFEICKWQVLTMTGIRDKEFPLKNLEFLEKLNTNAAVDSTSEFMATAGLVSLVVGEAMVPLVDPSLNGCGMFNECDEDGSPKRSVISIVLVILVAFTFRVVFFAIERSALKRIMRYASKIEANGEIWLQVWPR